MIFDGHNDALSRLWCAGGDPVDRFSRSEGHVNYPDCRAGGFAGGFFALYSPTRRAPFDLSVFANGGPEMDLPPPLDEATALAAVIGQLGAAHRLADAGLLRLITDTRDIDPALEADAPAVVLHLEGADAIGRDLLALDTFFAAGLRSIGPVWSRPTIFGDGVPFRSGPDGDTGPGVTEDGKRLLARCRQLGLIVDTSHMTLRGFWDVAEAGFPLVATHSNACAVAPATRNLTDGQLRAISETRGMVGLNFGTIFLSKDAWQTGRATLDDCVRQLSHMIEVAGEDHVGLGSDFDGAPMPQGLGSARDLPALVAALDAAGFDQALIRKVCFENWRAFLLRASTKWDKGPAVTHGR